jgi:hypothetical protein
MPITKKPTNGQRSNSYRSGLEQRIAEELLESGVHFKYEDQVIEYLKPAKIARYTPDFFIEKTDKDGNPTGKFLICEAKGRFLTSDRQKMLLVKHQHPELDIRFVFSRSKERISKKSKTTYAMWCEKHGFLYADERIPDSWLKEHPNVGRK